MSSVPPGFEEVYIQKGNSKRTRKYYRCLWGKDKGEQCVFMYRSDVKLKSPHIIHQPPLKLVTQKEEDNAIIKAKVLNIITCLIAVSNISLYKATNENFKEFIRKLLEIGNSLPADFDLNIIFRDFTFPKLRSIILNKASKLVNLKLQKFVLWSYASIAIDGGNVNGTNYFDVYLCNPSENLKPLLIYSTTNHDKFTETIKNDIASALSFVRNVHVHAIVGDNFVPQVKACNEIISDALSNQKILFFVPCACHLLNLVLINTYKECNIYFSYVHTIRKIGKKYNKIERSLKIRHFCPEHIETRWVSDLDIAYFLYINYNRVIERMTKENQIEFLKSGKLKDFILLLAPFRAGIQNLEGNRSKIGDIYPIVLKIIEFYDDHANLLQHEDSVTILNALVNNIRKRFNSTKIGHILQLSYSLTPVGRNEIRGQMDIHTYEPDNFENRVEYKFTFETKYVRTIFKEIGSPWFSPEADINNSDMQSCDEEEEEDIIVGDLNDYIIEEENDIFENSSGELLENATNALTDLGLYN